MQAGKARTLHVLREHIASMHEKLDNFKKRMEDLDGKGKPATVVKVLQAKQVDPLVCYDTDPPQNKLNELMSNEQLAYEMLIDKDFRFHTNTVDPACDDVIVYAKARKTCMDDPAFFKSLRDDLDADTPYYATTISVMEEVKAKLLVFSKDYESGKQLIEDGMDIDHVRDNIKAGVLDFSMCTAIVDNMVKIMCGMFARMGAKDGMKEAWETKHKVALDVAASERDREKFVLAMSDSFAMVCDKVHVMEVEHANAKLKTLFPVSFYCAHAYRSHLTTKKQTFSQHGVGYVRKHFENKIKAGVIPATLDNTVKWISDTVNDVFTNPKSLLKSQLGKSTLRFFGHIVKASMVRVVVDGVRDDIPETLLNDVARLKAMHLLFHSDVAIAVVLSYVSEYLRARYIPAPSVETILSNISSFFKTNRPRDNNLETVMTKVGAIMHEECPSLLLPPTSHLKGLVRNRAGPVYSRMVELLSGVLYRKTVITGQSEEFVGIPAEVAKGVMESIHRQATVLNKVSLANIRIHTDRYNAITKDAIHGANAASTLAGGPVLRPGFEGFF